MKTLWKTAALLAAALAIGGCTSAGKEKAAPADEPESGKVIVAYVGSGDAPLPDPFSMTHINYAFGDVNETFNGVKIQNETRLRDIASLKQKNKRLKVLLSIGGWESGRFSEMAADSLLRRAFSADCGRIAESFGLDGIDIDWEYPTSGSAGISSSPADTDNYTLLMRDLRQAIEQDKLLTLASVASAQYIDFKSILPYIDFVNIMSYDMANAPKHHSPLYASGNTGEMTADKAVKAHLAAGIPADRLTLGMAFYGRGGQNGLPTMAYHAIPEARDKHKCTEQWDEEAKIPYLANEKEEFVLGYDNPRSLDIKCKYIVDNGLLGGMYWVYDSDNADGELRKTLYERLMKSQR